MKDSKPGPSPPPSKSDFPEGSTYWLVGNPPFIPAVIFPGRLSAVAYDAEPPRRISASTVEEDGSKVSFERWVSSLSNAASAHAYGANNKIVTREMADTARQRLRKYFAELEWRNPDGYSKEGQKTLDKLLAMGGLAEHFYPTWDGNVAASPEMAEYYVILGEDETYNRLAHEIKTQRDRTALDPQVSGTTARQPQPLDDAKRVLKPATIVEVERRAGFHGWKIMDRWAAASPARVRQLEASGQLVPRLLEQAKLERETLSDARVAGANQDVPDVEILQLNEIRMLP